MKSNWVICSADIDFCLLETDHPYDDDDNNDNLDDDRNRVYLNRRKFNIKGNGREFDSPNPYSFLFTILFKLKLGSTPIFYFITIRLPYTWSFSLCIFSLNCSCAWSSITRTDLDCARSETNFANSPSHKLNELA